MQKKICRCMKFESKRQILQSCQCASSDPPCRTDDPQQHYPKKKQGLKTQTVSTTTVIFYYSTAILTFGTHAVINSLKLHTKKKIQARAATIKQTFSAYYQSSYPDISEHLSRTLVPLFGSKGSFLIKDIYLLHWNIHLCTIS